MPTFEVQLPPLARALDRLGGYRPAPVALDCRQSYVEDAPAIRLPHDFLEIVPMDAPDSSERVAARPATVTAETTVRRLIEEIPPCIPGPEAARTYWFDL